MIARRVVLSIVTLLLVSLFIFIMVEALPGDAATRYLGRLATEEQKTLLRTRLKLDTPAPVRYAKWLGNMARLDFGTTMVLARPINAVLAPKIANTLILAGVAFVLYLPLSLIPASIQALNRDSALDHGFSVLTLVLLPPRTSCSPRCCCSSWWWRSRCCPRCRWSTPPLPFRSSLEPWFYPP